MVAGRLPAVEAVQVGRHQPSVGVEDVRVEELHQAGHQPTAQRRLLLRLVQLLRAQVWGDGAQV